MDILAFNPAAESLDAFNGRLHARCFDSYITGVVASTLGDGVVLSLTDSEDLPVSGMVFAAWVVDLSDRDAQLNPEAALIRALGTLRSVHTPQAPYVPVEMQVLTTPAGRAYGVFKIVRGMYQPDEPSDGDPQ